MLAACTAPETKTQLADLTGSSLSVFVDLGSAGQRPLVIGGIDYDDSGGCVTLDSAISARFNSLVLKPFHLGEQAQDGSCIHPSFSVGALPGRLRTTLSRADHIEIADASAVLTMLVDRLLVPPEMTLETEVIVGSELRVRIDDPRTFDRARVRWTTSDGMYSSEEIATLSGEEITLMVPGRWRAGAGTLNVVVDIDDADNECVGFTTCTLEIQAARAFTTTVWYW